MNARATIPIPPSSPLVPCKGAGCSAPIHWVRTANDRNTPVNPDGTPHWATCRNAPEFRQRQRLDARLADLKRGGT
jgi:hypothetical protein